jgi:hypothetical protein
VSLLVWNLTLDLSGLADAASSYATAGIAVEIMINFTGNISDGPDSYALSKIRSRSRFGTSRAHTYKHFIRICRYVYDLRPYQKLCAMVHKLQYKFNIYTVSDVTQKHRHETCEFLIQQLNNDVLM